MADNDSTSAPAFQQVSAANHGPWVIVASYVRLLYSAIGHYSLTIKDI